MPGWLMILLGVLGGLVTLSAVVLVIRGAWKEGKIAELRADNEDLRSRDEDRVKEIADLRVKLADCQAREDAHEARIVGLEGEKKTLIEAATQAGAVQSLATSFEAHKVAVQKRQGEIISKIDQALVLLERSAS